MNGMYVCHLGHQYHMNQEMGDEEELLNSQNFARSKASTRKSTIKKLKKHVELHQRIVKYKNHFKNQISWLVSKNILPSEAGEIARDLFAIWLKQSKPRIMMKFNNLRPYHMLVLCRLTAILLKCPLTYQELLKY